MLALRGWLANGYRPGQRMLVLDDARSARRSVRWYEALGLFHSPLGGLDRELSGVEAAIEKLALGRGELPDASVFRGIVAEAQAAQDRIQQAAHHELHRDPYRPEMAEQITRFVLSEVGRRPRERGLLYAAPGKVLGDAVREGLEGLRDTRLATELVVVGDGDRAALDTPGVIWVPTNQAPGIPPCLIHYGDGPAYALIREEARNGAQARVFHTDDRSLVEHLAFRLHDELDRLAADEGVTVATRELARFEPVVFDPDVVDLIAATASDLAKSVRRLPSGAGHDAQMMARVCPTGMVFVPSVAGISHNPAEHTEPEDIAAGADVLLRTLVQLATIDGGLDNPESSWTES